MELNCSPENKMQIRNFCTFSTILGIQLWKYASVVVLAMLQKSLYSNSLNIPKGGAKRAKIAQN